SKKRKWPDADVRIKKMASDSFRTSAARRPEPKPFASRCDDAGEHSANLRVAVHDARCPSGNFRLRRVQRHPIRRSCKACGGACTFHGGNIAWQAQNWRLTIESCGIQLIN